MAWEHGADAHRPARCRARQTNEVQVALVASDTPPKECTRQDMPSSVFSSLYINVKYDIVYVLHTHSHTIGIEIKNL